MGKKYVYPALAEPNKDFGFFRISGPGLANCMFVAARAYTYAKENHAIFVEPTWFKLSIGPYIRKEKDKRHYLGLFKHYGLRGLKKLICIKKHHYKENQINDFKSATSGVLEVYGLGNYFQDIKPELAKEYFSLTINDSIKKRVLQCDFSNKVAVHVRMGDYSYCPEWLTPLDWYKTIIELISSINNSLEFLLFSDGSDDDLKPLLEIANVKRIFFGNALADIYGISRCQLVIASNSTFSAWGAFIGNKPVLFYSRLFGSLYNNTQIEHVLGNVSVLPSDVVEYIDKLRHNNK